MTDYEPQYLDAQDGMYTQVEELSGRIHVTEVQVDDGVYLTREQISELAQRFPVPPSVVICPHGKVEVYCSVCDLAARFALNDAVAVAVMAERERCAKTAEDSPERIGLGDYMGFCDEIAEKIRSGE